MRLSENQRERDTVDEIGRRRPDPDREALGEVSEDLLHGVPLQVAGAEGLLGCSLARRSRGRSVSSSPTESVSCAARRRLDFQLKKSVLVLLVEAASRGGRPEGPGVLGDRERLRDPADLQLLPELLDEDVEVARPLLAEGALHVGVLHDRAPRRRPGPGRAPRRAGSWPAAARRSCVPRSHARPTRRSAPSPRGGEGRDVVGAVARLVLDLQALERAPVERRVEGDLDPASQEASRGARGASRGRTRPGSASAPSGAASSTKTSPTRAVFPVSSATTKAWSLARSSTVNFFEAR